MGKAKKTKASKPAPATDAADDPASEHLTRIRKAEAEVSRCENRLASLKKSAKDVKTSLSAAQKKLRAEIHDNNLRFKFTGNSTAASGNTDTDTDTDTDSKADADADAESDAD